MSKRVEPSPSLTDQVYAVLHEAITSGEYPAGYRLRIRDLAAEVGTSVMPVREAIRRLEEAGFAERVPHKGSVVKGQHLAELLHIYDTRQVLEVEAARRGATRIDEADAARMREEFELMRRAIADGAVAPYLDHDEALLAILYEAAGNPVLVNTIRTLWQHCRAYKVVGARAALDAPGDDTLWRYQEQLLKAAHARDGAAAAAITNESLANATDRIKEQLVSR
ncbi:GntR family transcriptional regulator [Streptomyces sp. TRM68416]|uniref:GntR family transcriptional regulator n=1 Tax=Streptomyces sp. TRM68416 TaxID=2758412 RepID=UPI001662027A|nr:GntR family transcriptional regulator [Streptomyces sp. TRM68416]MBD0844633.1 GntR family transcriptional regulator [Streptomyces sp. TRM68416]